MQRRGLGIEFDVDSYYFVAGKLTWYLCKDAVLELKILSFEKLWEIVRLNEIAELDEIILRPAVL